jgi:class 3 adenylate cyclase
VDFHILGPLEVVGDDGEPLPLRGGRQRTLVALLALQANEAVSADRLIEALWSGHPPDSALTGLQGYVSELRKLLGRERIETRPSGYLLRLADEELDAARFERMLAAGRAGEAAALEQALMLWRGEPLPELVDEPAARAELARLKELHMAALEERAEAELSAGRHAELVPELERLLASNPLRERLRYLLMLALYRSGRQVEALDCYRHGRQLLADELGLEPGRMLQELERAILRQDAALEPPEEPEPADVRMSRRQDRRTVTVVFCDLVDSTSLGEELDPEALRRLLAGYYRLASEVLARHGGTVEKVIGDAVVAVFGVPQLHDDDALRAVRAAVELRGRLEELNRPLELKGRIAVAVRIGINSGEVFAAGVGGREPMVTGDAVNLAARLEQMAAPGEIVLGAATVGLVGDAVRVDPLMLALRGKSQPVEAARLLELDSSAPSMVRGLDATFVGRERELAALRDILAGVTRARSCQLCILVGPPGMGKSRLAREFADEITGTATVAAGRCLSYGESITYSPLRETVRELTGGEPREWIKARLTAEAGATAIAERVMAAIGEGEAGAKPEETFWAFRKVFEALAEERPLVLIIDDIHWAEPTLLDLLEHLVGLSAGAPIMLLCLARPELFENRPEWGVPHPNRAVLSLPPLADDQSRALVERLERAQTLPERARVRAIVAAEGNPLFLEQLVAFESEGGSAVMPPSIRVLLAARIDQLPHGERAVLERAAIEGREFERAAVAELLPAGERTKLDERLLNLVRKDFIHPGRAGGQTVDAFGFRHILVREAAYEAMTKDLRAELHERYADWLELGRGEDEIVGYHLEQAVRYRRAVAPTGEQPSDLAVRAAERLGSAGRIALKRGDIRGAVSLLSRAAALPPPDTPSRLQLLPDLAEALSSVGELARADEVLTEAAERAAAAEDIRTSWRAQLQWTWLRFQTDPSVEVAGVLNDAMAVVAEFERVHDDRALAHAWHLIAWVHMTYGRLPALAEALRRGRQHAQAASDAMTEEDLAVIALLVGPTGPFPIRRVISDAEAEMARAKTGGSRRVEGAALLVLAMCSAFDGRFDQARQLLSAATSIDVELGGGRGSGFQYTPAGMIELLAGDTMRAEQELRTGYKTLRERGDTWFLCGVAAELADVLWLQGRDDEAFDLTQVSEETAGKNVLVAQMMWRGARAKVLARRGEAEKAEALAREGVAIIKQTDYVLYHADALTDLAEVLRLHDRFEEATRAADEARRLYEQKGNVVAARKVEALMEELSALTPAEGF